ncbi:hypothetical protein [Dysgonomonas reticulitermitis]
MALVLSIIDNLKISEFENLKMARSDNNSQQSTMAQSGKGYKLMAN